MAEIASAFITIAPSMRGFGGALNAQAGGTVRSSGKSLGAVFGKMFVLGSAVIAAAGIGSFLKGSIEEAREAQKVSALTANVLKTTGGVAKVSAVQVGRLADAISRKTGIDDEQIASSENLLLTFKNVRREGSGLENIFARATRASVDLAASGFGSAESTAKMLGKALNDPIKGLTALGRAGVTFSKTQTDRIKKLVEEGKLLAAQKIELREVESQVKGSAEAQATYADRARVAFGNLKEQIGTVLLPVIDAAAKVFVNKIAPAISSFVAGLQSGSGSASRFGDFIRVRVLPVLRQLGDFIVTKIVPAYRDVLQSVLDGATKAFDKVRGAIQRNRPELEQLLRAAKKVATYFYEKVIPALGVILGQAIRIFGKSIAFAIDHISGMIRTFNRLRDTFNKVRSGIGEVMDKFSQFVSSTKGKVETVVTAVQRIGREAWTPLRQGAARVKAVVVGVFNAISGAIQNAIDKAQALINKLAEVASKGKGAGVKGAGGPVSGPKKVGVDVGRMAVDGVVAGIASRDTALRSALDKVGKKVKGKLKELRDQLASLKDDFAGLVEPIAGNFTQGLFDFDTAGAFTANLTTVKGTLTTLLGNFKTLAGYGLSPGFLYKLFESGGPGLINSLAALPKADALGAGQLFGEVTSLADDLGTKVSSSTQEGQKYLAEQKKTNDKIDKLTQSGKDNTRMLVEALTQPARRARRRAVLAA